VSDSKLHSPEAERRQCQCHKSHPVDDQANASQCVKVTDLEKLVNHQALSLDSLKAEVQVASLITAILSLC